MGELLDSSSSSDDWAWVRWNRLRWDLVNALEVAAHHPGDELTADFGLRDLLGDLGLRLEESRDGWPRFAFLEELEEFVTSDMRDGLSMISVFYSVRAMALTNPFEGWLEIPQVIGEIYHADHFRGIARAASDEEIDFDLVREIVYAIATVALPDNYLRHV